MLVFLGFGGLWRLVFGLAPRGVGGVFLHGFAQGFGLLAEILLIDSAVVVHDKRHHSGGAVLGGISDESEALGHFAFGDVVFCSAGGMLALARENVKKIATIRSRRASLAFRVALGDGGSD